MMTLKPPALPPAVESIQRSLSELCVGDEAYHWENPRRFTFFARRLQLLLSQLLLRSSLMEIPSVQTALKGIAADLAKSVETVSVYRDKSKIYVLINCKSLCASLTERAAAIGRWLALLETVLGDYPDVRKKVADLSRDMRQTQFRVTENEERVHCTLQREGQGMPTTKAVQSAIVMDLARALGIDSGNHAELSYQVKLLKNDFVRSNSVSDRRILMSLEKIMDNWSVGPNLSVLSLDFVYDNESQISPFKSFLCPLTKEVMKDPVVLESSQTYERTAIEYWFERCLEDGRDPTCPVTGQVLASLEQKPNIGLAGAIEEWVNRNVDIQIKSAVKYLTEDPASLDCIERVLDSIYKIIEEHPSSRYKVRNAGIVVLIISILKSKSVGSILRGKALVVLLSMMKDEESKMTMLGEGITKLAIQSLVGSTEKEKESALKLLLEFSNDEANCVKIASEKGALVLLSSIAGNLEHPALSNLAESVLKRLELVGDNVRHLAATGRFEPLLSRLVEGPYDVKMEMAVLLGEMTLTNNNKEQIARQSAKVLVEMLSNPEGRTPGLQALKNLSALEDNATILVDSSALPALTEILFESRESIPEHRELAAAVIANIVSSPGHWELAVADRDGQTMHSASIISRLLQLLSDATPQCQASLLQILCGIASSPLALEHVVAEIDSGEGIKIIVRFLEHPETEQRTWAFKLARILSESSESLFNELRNLSKIPLLRDKLLDNQSTITEKSHASCILANLPLSVDEVGTVLGAGFLKWTATTLREHQRIPSGRASRTSSTMTEGLLGLLLHYARCTDSQTLSWVQEHRLMAIFLEQLTFPSQPRCKELSALGLKHLSESGRALISDGESDPLPPQGLCSSMVFMCGRAPPRPFTCPIHNAPCEEETQLCLLKSDCIKPLVDLLLDEHTDVQIAVVEALSTLIPDTPHHFRRAVDELEILGVADAVITLFIDARPGELQEKTIWVVERLLRGESTSHRHALNQSLVRALVEALKHGNANTRKLAQDALTNLKQLSGASGKISGPIRAWR